MPTYQYACTACHERLEAVQSFSDPALTECPACGGALRKVFSAVGVVFKGSGFYKTDSRNGSSGAPAKAEGASTDTAPTAGGTKESSTSGSSSSTGDAGSSSSTAKPTVTAPASKSA